MEGRDGDGDASGGGVAGSAPGGSVTSAASNAKRWLGEGEEEEASPRAEKERGRDSSSSAPTNGKDAAASSERLNGKIAPSKAGSHPWSAFYSAQTVQGRENGSSDKEKQGREKVPSEREKPAAVPLVSDRDMDGDRAAMPPLAAQMRMPRGGDWRAAQAVMGTLMLEDERISHCLSRILRYHTESVGLHADEEGFVPLSEMLSQVPEFQGITEEDIRRVVHGSLGSRGPRFEIREAGDVEGVAGPDIRALYKHPKEGCRPFGMYGWGRSGMGPFPRGGYMRGFGGRGFPGQFPPPWYAERDAARQPPMYRQLPRGARPRPGFSQPPPPDADEEDEGPARAAAAAALLGHSQDAWEQHGPLDQGGAAGPRGGAAASDAGVADDGVIPQSAASQSAGPASGADAAEDRGEVWERYHDQSGRTWFWNESTEEVFYADDESSGWQRFTDPKGSPWWWHESSGRFFYEEEDDE